MPKSISKKELSTNKLYQVLLLLSSEERKRFVKFVDSPYFNQSELLKKLLEGFLSDLEKNETKGFSKDNIWKKLYPKTPFNDTNFRKFSSDLIKLLERFLVVEKITTEEENFSTILFESVVKKALTPLYTSSYSKAAHLNKQDEIFHTSNQLINNIKIELGYFNMKNFTFKPTEKWNTSTISKYLDEFYWSEKLKLSYSSLIVSKKKKFDYDIWFQDKIEDLFETFNFSDSLQIATYYYMFLSTKENENTKHYYSIKNILTTFGDTLPIGEANNVYDSALNYCIGHVNKGINLFFEEFIELTELGLKTGLIFVNGEISPARYSNAVSIAMRIKKTEWALNFIESYKEKLPLYTRENTYVYSLARIYFHEKKFNDLLQLLLNVEFEDLNYSLIGKAMQATAYYELDELDALDSYLDSFKVYISRNKNIPPDRKKSNQNFIRYIKKLTRMIPGDKAAKEKLRLELLENRKNTRNYEWLMEKVEEL